MIFKDEIITPQTFYYHNFQMTPLTDSTNLLVRNAEESIEQQIATGVSDPKEEKIAELKAYKGELGILAARINRTYQLLASNLVPSLLKAHDSSGSELNKIQFDANDLQIYDIVFDQNTYLKTGNLRSSLYSVMYISKDKKSLLIAKPRTHILKKSKYPNSKLQLQTIFIQVLTSIWSTLVGMFVC